MYACYIANTNSYLIANKYTYCGMNFFRTILFVSLLMNMIVSFHNQPDLKTK